MKRHKARRRFVLCIRNAGFEDVERLKVYRALPDPAASVEGYVRVIDESGEDYLYPSDCFVLVDLPEKAAKALDASPRLERRNASRATKAS